MRIAVLPIGVGPRHVFGGAVLTGIGFTVALFIADLSFGGTPQLPEAKLAILAASITAGILGALILTKAKPMAVTQTSSGRASDPPESRDR